MLDSKEVSGGDEPKCLLLLVVEISKLTYTP